MDVFALKLKRELEVLSKRRRCVFVKMIPCRFQNSEDLDLCVQDHCSYGKGFIKSCRVSFGNSLFALCKVVKNLSFLKLVTGLESF